MPFGVWLARNVRADTPYIRYDIDSPQGLEMLTVFANAVAAMKARGEMDALSWQWQWYTHFVNGATTKSAEISRMFGTTVTPQSTLANEMWNTCQSHAGQNANHFLPWHRMFVFYFEQIVRQVSGRPDFTLPYWNYTSYDPAKRGIVPLQFRMPTDPVFSSLYRADRTTLANSGQPIHKNQTGDAMDISTAMAAQNYSSVDSVQGFCRALDSGIHGRIHVLVGTSKNMGAVPYAGRDPLFWVHHSNIDRLWASWNLNGGANPTTGTWLNKSFVFADGTGQRVTGKLKDFFDANLLGYGYDRYVGPDGQEGAMKLAASTAAVAVGKVAERIGTAPAVELGERPVRAALRLVAGKPANALDTTSGRHTYLVIKDLHAWSQPEVLYHVYIAPRGGGPNPNTYVGNINFFDAEFHDHGNGAMGDALGENFYSFDITALLQRLASSSTKAIQALEVTFVPGGRPTPGAKPLVGSIQLVWQ
jgi:tyrosinase